MIKKTLGILSAVALSSVAQANVSVSGYVDAGYDWSNAAGAANDFLFHEGGVWFSGNSGNTSFLLDIGVRPGVALEQGYVSHKFDNGFGWSLGQFDGILGTESNDSVNNTFVHTGILKAFVPSTHTGLMFGYDLSDALKLNLIVANGTGTSTDVGFKIGTSMDGMNAAVGGHFTSLAGETGYVIDVTASSAFGAFEVGAELLLNKAAVADAESGMGFGIHAGTEVAAATKLNAGFEWTNENAGDAMEFRVGPSFAASEAMTVKADYTWAKVGEADAGHGIALAGVYKF